MTIHPADRHWSLTPEGTQRRCDDGHHGRRCPFAAHFVMSCQAGIVLSLCRRHAEMFRQKLARLLQPDTRP